MPPGKRSHSEKTQTVDPVTGTVVNRLTQADGWHILPYFTNTAFTPDSSALVFDSDRSGKTDVYSIDIKSGELTQLTDIPPESDSPAVSYVRAGESVPRVRCDLVSWIDRKVYYLAGREFRRVDIDTVEDDLLWHLPENLVIGRPHMNSDGTHLLFPCMDREVFNIPEEHQHLRQHYIWKRVAANPDLRSYLSVLEIASGRVDEWMAENAWISHAQFSPLDWNRILYCHEGVWEDVDDRMWMFDRRTGKTWNLRHQTHDVCIGHEIWMPGSERILYHGWIGDDTLVGLINADGSDMVEYRETPRFYGHFAPNRDGSVVVTDAGVHEGVISLVTFKHGEMAFHPLCRHGNIWKHPWDHPHPHFSPDGRYVVFNASHRPGNSSVYLAEVPEKYRG